MCRCTTNRVFLIVVIAVIAGYMIKNHGHDGVLLAQGVLPEEVRSVTEQYVSMHSGDDKLGERKENHTALANMYYDLVTDFYEYGWGSSFHFAPRHKYEGFHASIARHEHYLAMKMKMEKDQKILDVGCGVGGPAREIARFSEAHVTGLNNNAYQIKRAKARTIQEDLVGRVDFVKGNFMEIPYADESFDGVYEIEATAHAKDKVECYKELLRVVKPGGYFGSYEWCLTDKYDATNERHKELKWMIEIGDGLPDIAHTSEVVAALKEAGWEVLEAEDLVYKEQDCHISWYDNLVPKYELSHNFQHTWLGRNVLAGFVGTLELVGLAPAGTGDVSAFLNKAADGLVGGGQEEIFTPMFFTLARKPLEKPAHPVKEAVKEVVKEVKEKKN
jgi:sterol 24-C-methyltransferase